MQRLLAAVKERVSYMSDVFARTTYYQLARLTPRDGPTNLFIETSAVCPLSCPMCPTTATSERLARQNKLMPIETFRLVMQQCHPDALTLHFSGEPTLHPQLCQFIGEAKNEYQVPFVKFNTGVPYTWDLEGEGCSYITRSGTVATKKGPFLVPPYVPRVRPEAMPEQEWHDLKALAAAKIEMMEAVLASGIDLITFSMEVDEGAQSKYRVGVYYKDAVRRIHSALKMRMELINQGCNSTKQTKLEIQHLVAQDVDVPRIVGSLRMWEQIALQEGYDVAFDPAKMAVVGDEFGVHVAKMSCLADQVPDFGGGRNKMGWCKMCYTTLIVGWDGKVAPCCMDHAFSLHDKYKWSNVADRPIKEIWGEMEGLRDRHRKDRLDKTLDDYCIKCLKYG